MERSAPTVPARDVERIDERNAGATRRHRLNRRKLATLMTDRWNERRRIVAARDVARIDETKRGPDTPAIS
jgi:hypothetical protein